MFDFKVIPCCEPLPRFCFALWVTEEFDFALWASAQNFVMCHGPPGGVCLCDNGLCDEFVSVLWAVVGEVPTKRSSDHDPMIRHCRIIGRFEL
jgi:hypothetical protein